MKTPTLDKEIHFPTLASAKIKIQGGNVIFVLPMLVTYVIVQHRKCKIPRLEGHILDYQVWSSIAVFRLERATEVLELTYLGKYFACVNAN